VVLSPHFVFPSHHTTTNTSEQIIYSLQIASKPKNYLRIYWIEYKKVQFCEKISETRIILLLRKMSELRKKLADVMKLLTVVL